LETGAHVVDVEAEFAGLQAHAFGHFGFLALDALVAHRGGVLALHDADAVVVGDDDVTGVHERTGADDGHVHTAKGFLHGALGVDGLGPDREAHFLEVTRVAHAGVDDQAAYAAGLGTVRQEVAEEAVSAVGGYADDEDVAGFAEFDCHVDHPVVAGLGEDGHGAAGDALVGVDRTHVGSHQANPTLRLMHCGYTQLRQVVDNCLICTGNVTYCNGFEHGRVPVVGKPAIICRAPCLLKSGGR